MFKIFERDLVKKLGMIAAEHTNIEKGKDMLHQKLMNVKNIKI